MTTQPEALRLADELLRARFELPYAATELRRLHAVNAELLKALEEYVNADPVDDALNPRKRKARAAIAAYQAKQRGEA